MSCYYKIKSLNFMQTLTWVFLVGNVILCVIHELLLKLPIYSSNLSYRYAFASITAIYLMFSLREIYTKRNLAPLVNKNMISIFVFSFMIISLLTFAFAGSISPMNIIIHNLMKGL